ncbi:uncharacterized protein N7483_004456 [Penicillium malachiteum]|uniref:uncharacterized protein n=1 Tax=Penicillium malachiteum TaxID=1324776 RepID=UPI002548E502|nr:uncharacterized protein N7483_004456 [Penicillium malachiteum]KAJ5729948.1 hypothetical protein N7483_004456 [Penicillium malachiteum]
MEYAAPYAITPTDRTRLIVIVETLFMSWIVIVSLIRLYMRITINGPVQMDELTIFVGIENGFGQKQDQTSPSSLKRAGEDLYAGNLLFLIGHGTAKISVCLILKRLGQQRNYLLYSKIILGMLLSAAILNTSWISWPSKSIAVISTLRGRPSPAFDVFTDVLSFGLCIFLVWGIQMRLKEKFTVIFAFGTRLPLIILIILRQTYLNNAFHHPDPSLTLSNAVIATAVLLHTRIMIATVPCLRPFVISFNTGWGQGVNGSSGNSYFTPTGQSSNQSRAYASRAEEDEVDLTIRPSEESHHSQQLIIRHTQEWKLEEEYEMNSVKDQVQI